MVVRAGVTVSPIIVNAVQVLVAIYCRTIVKVSVTDNTIRAKIFRKRVQKTSGHKIEKQKKF